MTDTTGFATFGQVLRSWRTSRGLSQEKLAQEAEVSARHLSFLETGRAAPSREMVLVLGAALDLPLRDRNAMLGAAGFAPVYAETPLDGSELSAVRRALDHLLRAHEPNGAVVVDRAWNLLRMNEGASRLMRWVLGDRFPDARVFGNALRALFHPDGLRPAIVNYREIAEITLARMRHELRAAPHPPLEALYREILALPDVASLREPVAPSLPFMPVHLRVSGVDVRLFTTVTTLGTPLDVTAQELRIESYFPADEASERFVLELSSTVV